MTEVGLSPEGYYALIKQLGLRFDKDPGSDRLIYRRQDGTPQTVTKAEKLTPDERKAEVDLLRMRLGINHH